MAAGRASVFDTALYPYARSPDQDAARPARHPVVVVGAGPVGLALALDLAQAGQPVLVLDDNDKVSTGSRAICYAKRTLEILDRLGCGAAVVDHGVVWQVGKVFNGDRRVYEFNLLPEAGHKRPAFVNLQQYHLEDMMVARATALRAAGAPIEIRGGNRVTAVEPFANGVHVRVETPEGSYTLDADWLVACDGANSPIRGLLGLGFRGQVFEDNFLIADVVMEADFPTERWFWFDPPFNPGRSALLHKQPDGVWRIDLQLGWGIDKTIERDPERVRPRIQAMLGPEARFDFEWISIYTFQCRRMERFRHGRVLFAGDAAHQVSPFGARGANSGIQDADNLAWKLALVLAGHAPGTLLDSYDDERVRAADENISHSTRSTEFIAPKSGAARLFRDSVLRLSERFAFARPMVNSGRLSVPTIYDGSPLNGPDDPALPARTRPGAPVADAPLADGWLIDRLGGRFVLLAVDMPGAHAIMHRKLTVDVVALRGADDTTGALRDRYVGRAPGALYLIRPDQHVAARWTSFDANAVQTALDLATGYDGASTWPT